ncbi:glycosyltransferase [Mucilaginibacter terrae]|uniref:Glycosyltransferase involved in cell wall biosynthesis n=1 Tax=Mucilaginibacter terrae TaxID=1955052 RepID=A0ABU3GYQ4_9SPHI|nr:glycosyltransferase [Mucilaginibacter terrae]MDT3404785.1 glycosyltransferase involved in cell wall biosynthesis [Mucilaginibacter terrae]
MESKIIVHVSQIDISPETGMGRVEYYWKDAFERAGYQFIHIGPTEVGPVKHGALFPRKAYQYFKKLNIKPLCFIVHEPAAGAFVKKGIPCFVESHGVERRNWEATLNGTVPGIKEEPIKWRTRLLYPIWRLSGCDKGLRYANKLLLINTDDKVFVKKRYNREDKDILVFKNGVNALPPVEGSNNGTFTVLFNATWVMRKGVRVLIDAAALLYKQGLKINYLLIGGSRDEQTVLSSWPHELHPFVTVVPRFKQQEEVNYLAKASVLVLPSYAEGQPLSLLQAMAAGKCAITSNADGQKDLITNGVNGFLFTNGSHEELADQIKHCYNNPEVVAGVGANAKEYTRNLTWENVSNQIVEFVVANSK